MSLDLYERESIDHIRRLGPAPTAEASMFDGFIRGTTLTTMQGLAKVGRAIDLLGAVGPIAEDAFTGGTEAQDRYFREHDQVWGRAVDFWEPKPHEVGAAARIAGTLLSTLPLVLASPSLAVGSLQLSVAEDLINKGVDPITAQMVGTSQAVGLGLGIYMPIFGRSLTERVLYGGIGFNVAQGIGMRAAGEALLEGTPAEGEFKTFDPAALTLDVILGAAFGAITHLSPAQRAQGAEMWDRLENLAKGFKSSDVDALAALRVAQHLAVDSLPGKPAEPVDLDFHAQRVRTALEQLLRDEPVTVNDLPEPRLLPDEARNSEALQLSQNLAKTAETVRREEGLPEPPPVIEIPDGDNLTPEQRTVETKARAQVQQHLEGMVKAYDELEDSKGGKILSTDTARELFEDYRAARWLHSASVHEPSSALIKVIYARRLATPDPLGLNMVTFTAGGTGAGKSTALGADELATRLSENSQIVYDTNMQAFRSAANKVDLALSHGRQVNIFFVGADPYLALRRALKRAMKPAGPGSGRTVPLLEHAKTHVGSAATLETMMEHYAGNDRVQFFILDNTGRGPIRIIEPENAREFLKTLDFENINARLLETLNAEYKAGRIDERIYRGFKEGFPEGTGAPAGRGGEEGTAAGSRPGSEGGKPPAPARPEIVQPPEPGAPAAKPQGPPGTPPPLGTRVEETAGAEGRVDPLEFEARRLVEQYADLPITIGRNVDGSPITTTVKQLWDEAMIEAETARQDIVLFEAAATCLLGRS